MRTTEIAWVGALTVLALLASSRPASGQVIITDPSALQNAASAGARAPGNMVAAGLSRALDGPVIIETAQPGWFEDVFVPQASDVIATQLSDTFTYLITLVLARAGVDVTLPTGLFTPTTTTDESTRDPSGTRDPRGKILRAAQ